jgi:predicted acyltransferase
VLLKLWWRAFILVLLGFLVNGAITWDTGSMRFASVLGLIGISGALAGSLTLVWRGRLIPSLVLAVLILVGVGTAQYLGGDFTPGGCFNAKVDARLCPGVLYSRNFDPEGPLCILSATALNLLGYCSGRVFLNVPGPWKRALYLILAGALLLGGSWFLPCIKGIWTPGFVLCSAGIGAICMAVFHLIIDVLGWERWSLPLRIVGLNALAAYVITHLVSFHILANRILGGTWGLFLSADQVRVANAATALLLGWLLCCFLYRKRVFIKL